MVKMGGSVPLVVLCAQKLKERDLHRLPEHLQDFVMAEWFHSHRKAFQFPQMRIPEEADMMAIERGVRNNWIWTFTSTSGENLESIYRLHLFVTGTWHMYWWIPLEA